MPKRKPIKNKNRIVITVIAVIVLLALAEILFINVLIVKKQNSQKGLALDDFYSEEQCKCIEKNKPACALDGFIYNETRNLCVNSQKKIVTYPSFECSKYECSGMTYAFNFDTKLWEEK